MTLIKQWRQELKARHEAILKKHGFTATEEKTTQVLNKKQAKLEIVLRDGLDIGGIIKCIVLVKLSKHLEHGWVFVKQDGEMFPVKRYL